MTAFLKPSPGIAFFLVLFGAWALTSINLARAARVKEPSFTVTGKYNGFELRSYGVILKASTPLDGQEGRKMDQGFRRLARYIFGGNSEAQQIAMTAPVIREGGEGNWHLSFVMPSDMTLDDLPQPVDERVSLSPVPARTVAALRFSGWATDRRVKHHTEKLLNGLDEQGIQGTGEAMVAQYDPPFRLPFLRRNEILIEVAQP